MKRKFVFLVAVTCIPLAVFGFYRGSALSNPSISKSLVDNAPPVSTTLERYNRLIHEKSPYLLQHADNLIYWYPWGEEAFTAARVENKPIFLSIGYSSCHWCHVLEKESFENQEVADLLNQGYISIKVDREENPDVDKFYMNIVQAMTGGGGWPMTVVMTPDLIPFFGGTYFPRDQLIKILQALHSAWENQPEKIKSIGEKVSRFIEASNDISAETASLNEEIFKAFYIGMVKSFDAENGGFGRSPKFPSTMKLRVLLRIAHRTGSKKPLAMVESTLEHMARGGIYDHLGGGFHRYSTDRVWLVPHFEKMLYNQAALSLVYLEAFQFTQNKMFESVARGILDYVLKDMTGPGGGFYSAEDADSEGEEGIFYVWSSKELKNVLTQDEYKRAKKVYGVSSKGNFGGLEKGTNILHLQKGSSWDVKMDPVVKVIHKKLLSAREKRIRPNKDDKIITAWNGLMLGSMAKAYQVLGDEKYLIAAQKAAWFIKNHLYQNEKLARRFRAGEVKHAATLDDYAYLIQGLIDLYEADFDERWINWARRLQKKQDDLFWDAGAGAYFYSEKSGNFLPVRKIGFADSAMPNSNAVAALNLLKLYNFTFENDYLNKSRKILSASTGLMVKVSRVFTQMLIAMDFYLDRSKEIAVVGPANSLETNSILKTLRTRFIPNKTLAYSPPNTKVTLPILEDKVTAEGKTTVYVCENNVCKYPTGDMAKIKELVFDNKKYSLN
jgi:uncharacterized protein YyaL (SSP411 family)